MPIQRVPISQYMARENGIPSSIVESSIDCRRCLLNISSSATLNHKNEPQQEACLSLIGPSFAVSIGSKFGGDAKSLCLCRHRLRNLLFQTFLHRFPPKQLSCAPRFAPGIRTPKDASVWRKLIRLFYADLVDVCALAVAFFECRLSNTLGDFREWLDTQSARRISHSGLHSENSRYSPSR